MFSENKFREFEIFKEYYENGDPAHDWSHILRVVNTVVILSKELNVDTKLLVPATFLHDVVNVSKNDSKRKTASSQAANKAKELLVDFGFSNTELSTIAEIIREHSYSAGLPPTTIESEILQDADTLDSLGAIGIMRWISIGTAMNAKFYKESDPYALNRELNDKEYSLDHFQTKLLKLYDRLNTIPARNIGKRRIEFMNDFLGQLKREIV